MKPQHIIGIVLLVAGVVLFFIGISASDSFADRASNFFTGQYTDSTMWYLIGGGALAIGGLALAVAGGRWSKA